MVKFVEFEKDNVLMNDEIVELQEKVEVLENENEWLYNEIDGMKEDFVKVESEVIVKRRMEWEIKGFKFDLVKGVVKIENFEVEI